MTLNPVETAKAFNMPRHWFAGTGYGVKDIIKHIGDVQVGYIQVQLQDAAGNPVPGMELRPLEMRENVAN